MNGTTKKAIIETIPNYLKKIHSALVEGDDTHMKTEQMEIEVLKLDPYTEDVIKHVDKVRANLYSFGHALGRRAEVHDQSKLLPDEFELMAKNFDRLRTTTYGSPEYKALLEENKPSISLHYQRNDHHPEHFENGVDGMDLMQVVEMLCDWKAAIEKHADGNIQDSLEYNRVRFGMSDQLYNIFVNTINRWGK